MHPEKKKASTTAELSKEVREKVKALAQRINNSLERDEEETSPRLAQGAVAVPR